MRVASKEATQLRILRAELAEENRLEGCDLAFLFPVGNSDRRLRNVPEISRSEAANIEH